MPRKRKPARPTPIPGQIHGEAGRQEAAIQQVAQAAETVAPPVFSAPPLPPVIPLDAPTQFPDEPVTAGLSIGPGPGPEALGMQRSRDPTLARLQALYLEHPNEDLRRLLEHAESNLTLPELSA